MSRKKPIQVVDTTVAEQVANALHGSRYGVDWIWHDDRLGYLLTKPVKTFTEVAARLRLQAMIGGESNDHG